MIGRPLAVAALAWALAGCAGNDGTVAPSPEGHLDILGAYPAFGLGQPPAERAALGFFSAGEPDAPLDEFAPTSVDDRPAVRVSGPGGQAMVGRRTAAPLLATPFLHWRWRMMAAAAPAADAPVTLLVGFSGGGGPALEATGEGVPAHRRLLAIVWAGGGVEPGGMMASGPVGRFVARAGSGGPSWWMQAVDLADLHRRLWPGIRPDEAQVTFIALAARASTGAGTAEVADVVLSR